MMTVWIAPHERSEALEAYSDWLNEDQVAQINEATEKAWITLYRSADSTKVVIRHDRP